MFYKKAIIFSAPSGAGKTTIVNHLLDRGLNLDFSISACSRAPRGNETNGKEYYFLSSEEFKEKIKQNLFVEWEEVYSDMYYGTLKSELERIWKQKKQVIFDVDVDGGISLKKYFKDQALSIFIEPPSIEVLKQRLENRNTDSKENISKRLAKAKEEINKKDNFDIIITNDELENACNTAFQEVKKFLK